MESAKSINRIASEFLHEYLRRDPTASFPRLDCAKHKPDMGYSDEVAKTFIKQLQATEPDRVEISEPESVILVRVCPKRLPAYFAGIRREKVIWTYHQHLAHVFQRDEASAVSKMLEGQSIANYLLPAPEPKHSSF